MAWALTLNIASTKRFLGLPSDGKSRFMHAAAAGHPRDGRAGDPIFGELVKRRGKNGLPNVFTAAMRYHSGHASILSQVILRYVPD